MGPCVRRDDDRVIISPRFNLRLLRPDFHPRIPEQHLSRFLGGAGHRRVVADQILRNRAVDEQRKLGGKAFRIGCAEL